jgi:hypothetical protein
MLLRVSAGWKSACQYRLGQTTTYYAIFFCNDIAYRSEDDMLVAYVSYVYGSVIMLFGEIGLSVMYAKNGIDLYEKLSYPIGPGQYQFIAELLYKVREYAESIRYGKKGNNCLANFTQRIQTFYGEQY